MKITDLFADGRRGARRRAQTGQNRRIKWQHTRNTVFGGRLAPEVARPLQAPVEFLGTGLHVPPRRETMKMSRDAMPVACRPL